VSPILIYSAMKSDLNTHRHLNLDFFVSMAARAEHRSNAVVDFVCEVLNALPKVETVHLSGSHVALLSIPLLELTRSHSSLSAVYIDHLTIRNGLPLPLPAPSGQAYTKVIISRVMTFAEEKSIRYPESVDAMLKTCRQIFELGITVKTLQMGRISHRSLHGQDLDFGFNRWAITNFRGLTSMSCERPFTLEGDHDVEDFFARHPTLLQLQLGISDLTQRQAWIRRSPSLREVLEGSSEPELEWDLIFRRSSIAHPFRCSGISLEYWDSSDAASMKSTLSHMSKVYPDLDTLEIHDLFLPISSGLALFGDLVRQSLWFLLLKPL